MARALLLGATGTIGRATAAALARAGHDVVAPVRPRPGRGAADLAALLPGVEVRPADPTDPAQLGKVMAGANIDAVVSCMASRTGAPRDAWAIDHDAHVAALEAAEAAGIGRFVLLSAICVQKPRLAFQHAKLAFEDRLRASSLAWSIVRPTAFFKSLSGQIERVRQGKPYLLFGDGRLTACKPISDGDLGAYLARCLTDPALDRRILPVGGPGPAITPLDQGEELFRLLGRAPAYRRVPVAMMGAIAGGLGALGLLSRKMADKAELARIGRYYATESMLVWDREAGRYDADATPEFGAETLFDHYARVLRGEAEVERGEHAVF